MHRRAGSTHPRRLRSGGLAGPHVLARRVVARLVLARLVLARPSRGTIACVAGLEARHPAADPRGEPAQPGVPLPRRRAAYQSDRHRYRAQCRDVRLRLRFRRPDPVHDASGRAGKIPDGALCIFDRDHAVRFYIFYLVQRRYPACAWLQEFFHLGAACLDPGGDPVADHSNDGARARSGLAGRRACAGGVRRGTSHPQGHPQALRRRQAGHQGRRSGSQPRRVRRLRRPVGLRQVHASADDLRAGKDHVRPTADWRRGHERGRGVGPRHRDGVPVLRTLPAHDGRREHELCASHGQDAASGGGKAGPEGRRYPADHAPSAAQAQGHVGWAATAGGDRSGNRARTQGVSVRRAAVEP